MGLMMGLLHGIKQLFKLIALPVTRLRSGQRFGSGLRWTLHIVLLVAVLVGLAVLNYVLDLGVLLRVPWTGLRMLWLPLLFFLIYMLAWHGWWLWRLLRLPPDESAWPDLEKSWNEAKAALERAGIDLAATPLFLVLGKPSGGIQNLFTASRLPLSVTQTPRSPSAPLHVFGNSEAVYVACSEMSLLSRQAAMLAEASADECHTRQNAPDPADEIDLLAFDDGTIGEPVVPTVAGMGELDQAVALLVEEEESRPEPSAQTVQRPHLRHAKLLNDGEQIERCTERLRHLGRLIARDREPYCTINGLLVLVPFAATGDELTADETAVLLQRDLETLQETLQVRCPLITVLCDVEKAPGGNELLRRFPEQQRHRRLGVSLPHLAASDDSLVPEMISTGIHWVCQGLIRPIVYRLAQIGCRNGPEADTDLAGNAQLYRFLHEFRSREKRIRHVLTRSVCPEGKSQWMLAGCYLTATGEDALRQQGFAGGVFAELVQLQNYVGWTQQAFDSDAACRRWTAAGYAMLALLVAASVITLLTLS